MDGMRDNCIRCTTENIIGEPKIYERCRTMWQTGGTSREGFVLKGHQDREILIVNCDKGHLTFLPPDDGCHAKIAADSKDQCEMRGGNDAAGGSVGVPFPFDFHVMQYIPNGAEMQ